MRFDIAQNDTLPRLRAPKLKDPDGSSPVLTGASARFILGLPGESPIVNAAADIIDDNAAGDGDAIVEYAWEAGDTARHGTFQAEFEITFASGDVASYPNHEYIEVVIKRELGSAP